MTTTILHKREIEHRFFSEVVAEDELNIYNDIKNMSDDALYAYMKQLVEDVQRYADHTINLSNVHINVLYRVRKRGMNAQLNGQLQGQRVV